MRKLDFTGTCLETGETFIGSLMQFEYGTHTIAFKETDGVIYTSPVDPETVMPLNAEIIFKD